MSRGGVKLGKRVPHRDGRHFPSEAAHVLGEALHMEESWKLHYVKGTAQEEKDKDCGFFVLLFLGTPMIRLFLFAVHIAVADDLLTKKKMRADVLQPRCLTVATRPFNFSAFCDFFISLKSIQINAP